MDQNEKLVQYFTKVRERQKDSYLRIGQAHYLALNDIDPQFAQDILGTDNDPFYVDANLENFFKELFRRWDS